MLFSMAGFPSFKKTAYLGFGEGVNWAFQLTTTSHCTHIRPEFRERLATEAALFRPVLDPQGPKLQQNKAA